MKLWGKRDKSGEDAGDAEPSIVLLEVGGAEDEMPKFAYPLGPGTDVIGRDESCSIQILDAEVSRRQVSIAYDYRQGGFVAEDMGSRNGTKLNGERMTQPVVLREGDVLELGRSRVVFTSKRFEDQMSAVLHYKRYGEHNRGTLPGERSRPE